MSVHATAPSLSFLPQRNSICDTASAQALPRKQTDGDLGLVQPIAMLRSVVHGEPVPQPATRFLAKTFHQSLACMRAQMVHHQVDDLRLRVTNRDLQQVIGRRLRSLARSNRFAKSR